MKILSLFDGCSGGQQAITNLGITDYTYFSSEIDKYAIQVTQENFPNTIQIGDITKIKGEDYKNITLLCGGSPCQGFSFAGKQLNFEDERSKLFFEYVRILKEVKPKYFLLENVKMKKEYQNVISENLYGIQPILLDSSKLTAQSRKRFYWIGKLQEDGNYKQVKIEEPEDKGILLKNVLEDEVDDKYYMTIEQFKNLGFESLQRLYNEKAPTLNTSQGGHRQPKILVNKYNQRVMLEKCGTLGAGAGFTNKQGYQVIEGEHKIRKLTPLEYERLQGVKDNYTSCVSNSQRYKMLGNGWTIPVIEWILKYLIK